MTQIPIIMKKTLLLVFSLMCSNLFAQDLFVLERTLEGIYYFNNGSSDPSSYSSLSTFTIPTNVFYNSTVEGNSIVCKTYDTNYNLTTETYTFNIPSGYTIMGCYQINIANAYESEIFLIYMTNTEKYSKEGYYKAIAYNGYGEKISELGSASRLLYIYPTLYKINGQYKLIVHRYNLSAEYTDIYALNSKGGWNSTNKVKDDNMVSQIFDIRGNLIYQAPEEQLKQISLQQGIYIQKDENGNTKKFIVK